MLAQFWAAGLPAQQPVRAVWELQDADVGIGQLPWSRGRQGRPRHSICTKHLDQAAAGQAWLPYWQGRAGCKNLHMAETCQEQWPVPEPRQDGCKSWMNEAGVELIEPAERDCMPPEASIGGLLCKMSNAAARTLSFYQARAAQSAQILWGCTCNQPLAAPLVISYI